MPVRGFPALFNQAYKVVRCAVVFSASWELDPQVKDSFCLQPLHLQATVTSQMESFSTVLIQTIGQIFTLLIFHYEVFLKIGLGNVQS